MHAWTEPVNIFFREKKEKNVSVSQSGKSKESKVFEM
jgi:hypothetical protein